MRLLKFILFLNFLVTCICFFAFAESSKSSLMTGEIFVEGKLKFRFQRQEIVLGSIREITAWFRDLRGQELVSEEVRYEKERLLRYSYNQRQIPENGWLSTENQKFNFHYLDRKGQHRAEEDLTPNGIIVDQIPWYMHKHWDELMSGDDVEVRFAVMDRLETVGFKFFIDKEMMYDGTEAVRVKMKPTSFFIALFVPPIFLTFEKKGKHRLLELDGRLPIHEKHDDKWKAIAAVMKLKYH